MRRTEEVMMDVMGLKPLAIHPTASQEEDEQCEKTLFHIPRSIPPHGQRILAVMENGALKMGILTYLPQICERLLNGDSLLEEIVGSTCLQQLTRLIMVQMAWKDSKNSGQIPSDQTQRAALLMEKCLSDKKKKTPSHEIMLKRRKTATCDEGEEGRSEEDDKAFEPQMDKTKYGSVDLQLPSNNKKAATATTTVHNTTSSLTKTTVSVPMNIQEEDDRKSPYKKEPQAEQVLFKQKKATNKNKMITSLLKRDPSKFYFLWDLIMMPGAEEGGGTCEQTKRSASLQATKESTPEKCKVNMLELIRQGLESKYEDHVQKALREKDLKSLLCILTLLTDHEIPNAWRWPHSLPTSSHYPASHHRPRTNHSAQIRDRSEKKKKKHKAGCRQEPLLLHPSNHSYPSTIDGGNDRLLEKESQLHSNQPSMSSSDASRPTYHSTESDSDFHSEIWAILQRADAEEQDEKPLVQILPFFQEDTLDSINFPSHYTSVDEVETELNVQENAVIINESSEQLIAPDGNIPQGQEQSLSDSSSNKTESGPEIMSMEHFSRPPVPPTRIPTVDLTLIHGRVLSPHQELTEESESKTEGLIPHSTPKAEEPLEPYRGNVERVEIKETDVEKSIGEAYWESELRKSYTAVLNLLSNNPKIHMWIECNLLKDDHKGSTVAFQSIRLLFQSLRKLMEDRVGSRMEEAVRREKELRDMWGSERRLASQLAGLQAEMKALEHQHIPYILTLDFQIRILNSRLRKISKEIFQQLRDVVQETEFNAGIKDKAELVNLSKAEQDVELSEDHRFHFKLHHAKEYDKFKTKMIQMNRLLDDTIAHYDQLMSEKQRKLDDTVAQTAVNEKKVKAVQAKYADVQSRYIDMCAEKKLKQIMKNMEVRDERRRHRAAQTIQECWRRYKIRKRKRERRKARKGKKKGGGAPKKKA